MRRRAMYGFGRKKTDYGYEQDDILENRYTFAGVYGCGNILSFREACGKPCRAMFRAGADGSDGDGGRRTFSGRGISRLDTRSCQFERRGERCRAYGGRVGGDHCHIFLWTLFIKYCYTTKFNFSFQKGFDGYCDYFLADCFICE